MRKRIIRRLAAIPFALLAFVAMAAPASAAVPTKGNPLGGFTGCADTSWLNASKGDFYQLSGMFVGAVAVLFLLVFVARAAALGLASGEVKAKIAAFNIRNLALGMALLAIGLPLLVAIFGPLLARAC